MDDNIWYQHELKFREEIESLKARLQEADVVIDLYVEGWNSDEFDRAAHDYRRKYPKEG